jgi:uncharacterized protein (UPF0305 family)
MIKPLQSVAIVQAMDLGSFAERILARIGRHRKRTAGPTPDEVCTLLIDTFDEGEPGHPAAAVPGDEIAAACRRLERAQTKGEALSAIAREVERFDLRDLEQMFARFERKTKNLPEGYRDRLLPRVREQIFSAHHRLILLSRNGGAPDPAAPVAPAFGAYWRMVAEACREKAREKDPASLYLKYLLAGFTIFLLGEPAHPVGTPFPGGQIVDAWEGSYLCPVRDLADGVAFALCPFCPAVQSNEPTYPEMRDLRRERRKKECLQNYWTNYKG